MRKILFGIAVAAICCLTSVPAYAGRSLTVSPGFVRVPLSGDTTVPFSVSIKNDFEQAVSVEVTITDADTTAGNVRPLATSESAAAKAVQIVQTRYDIEPQKSVNIQANARSADLPSGGHYAALVIKPVDQNLSAQVPLQQAVSVGLFLAKTEGARFALGLEAGVPRGVTFSRPKNVWLRFKNEGNIDITPYASVSITKGSEIIARTTVNEGSRMLFAGQKIEYTPSLEYVRSFLPDYYKTRVVYRYAGQNTPQTYSVGFWYVPWWTVLLLCAIMLTVFRKRVRKLAGWITKIASISLKK